MPFCASSKSILSFLAIVPKLTAGSACTSLPELQELSESQVTLNIDTYEALGDILVGTRN
jgi:hypothetical protein